MNNLSLTNAELNAEKATQFPALQVNLHKIRDEVSQVLSEWKSSGFFSEYTDHSFNHVYDMLSALDWLIPAETSQSMTPADWLMLVLSIYFHDVGLIVTKEEFDERHHNADFKKFVQSPILTADKQKDLEARLYQMPPNERESLQYQEFVRFTHGKRIKAWLEGTYLYDRDQTVKQRAVIKGLVGALDSTFRRDLARLCESHTLENIDDTNNFKVSQPYGGPEETVNLQYCAVILRTVDLIQITRRRAPGVLYQLIDPSNPVSQLEWLRHSAVRTVRAAPGRDRTGKVSEVAQSDTIEVHATFKEPDGFFGLTSYLAYAQKEIKYCFNAIGKSEKDTSKPYLFPWKEIDTANIDTEGFLTEQFEFELDQHKILDLLTGHTLYNDTTVVLRELTQNALDAVRLQCEIEGKASEEVGQVEIFWNSKKRTLEIVDNGTGMTQEVIVRHLLKVGSSRYQDPKFRDKHPEFHSISRFGIGVLSAFMVSDDVEITTCSEEDESARQIALRSVHGKYLIKLLDKASDRDQLTMYPHGTSVKLVLRPSADVYDVQEIARAWLMFPRCRVRVHIDGGEPVNVGYDTPKAAIEHFLKTSELFRKSYKTECEVKEFSRDGTTVAFAIAKDSLFKDWGFVEVPRHRNPYEEDNFSAPIATCIEGVAVENSTPGFRGRLILAVANSTGKHAPKTNVARSALEDTEEYRAMLVAVYGMYSQHISEELERLRNRQSHSLTRAVSVGPFLAYPLLANLPVASHKEALESAIAEIPLVLTEEGQERKNISLAQLKGNKEFWTIESPLSRSVEYFVKESPADVTAGRIFELLGSAVSARNSGTTVCNLSQSSYVEDAVHKLFDVVELIADEEARRVELRWARRQGEPLWLTNITLFEEITSRDPKFWMAVNEFRERFRRNNGAGRTSVPGPQVSSTGLDGFGSLVMPREYCVVPGTALAQLLYANPQDLDEQNLRRKSIQFILLEVIQSTNIEWDKINLDTMDSIIDHARISGLNIDKSIKEEFLDGLHKTPSAIFDPFAWDQREVKFEF